MHRHLGSIGNAPDVGLRPQSSLRRTSSGWSLSNADDEPRPNLSTGRTSVCLRTSPNRPMFGGWYGSSAARFRPSPLPASRNLRSRGQSRPYPHFALITSAASTRKDAGDAAAASSAQRRARPNCIIGNCIVPGLRLAPDSSRYPLSSAILLIEAGSVGFA